MNSEIEIQLGDRTIARCHSAILVPAIAVTEPGYIKVLSVNVDAQSKHEFHALAQMAYYQYQDEELEITDVDTPVTVIHHETQLDLSDGMVICRDAAGALAAFAHGEISRKKLLEAAYRYCTRWVRLDI